MRLVTIIAICSVLFLSAEASSETAWKDVGDCGKGLTCDPSCQLKCLELHNYYRSFHGSPPMYCDPELAQSAQEWTDEQAKAGKMYHSKWTDKFTENLSWKGDGWVGMKEMKGAIPGAARSWYSEVKNGYNYETGEGNGQVIGHFQALVWKDSTKLGCGLNYKPGDGTYVTAHYSPASHSSVDKKKVAPENVKPRKQIAPSCDIKSSDRELCDEESKAPYVTPQQCVEKGCCYDDMFMKQPDVWYYKTDGRIWCFKSKGKNGSKVV